MKKNELENRLAEVEDVLATIEKTLAVAVDEAKRAETVRDELMRVLGEVSGFVKGSLENLQKTPEGDREKVLEDAMKRLLGWSQAENDRVKIRPQALQERVAALQSVTGWLGERGKSHKGRIEAIVRAADPERDKRRPEKLSVRRAAQELVDEEVDDE
jgi:hypothetical protein